MRAVAKYVMRGRNQALLVAVAGACTFLFAWLSAAVLALVTLRRGTGEGAYILVWAALPAGLLVAVFGDFGPLSLIMGTTALAAVLRTTVSWPLTLCVASGLGALVGVLMLAFGAGALEELSRVFTQVFEAWEAQAQEQGQTLDLTAPGITAIAGLVGMTTTIGCVMCLLLARWWQALLYNPGGFREEFHALRLSPAFSVGLVAAILAISAFGLEYRSWAMLFALPLCVAGLGLVHAWAAQRGRGATFMTLFYLLWVLLDPVRLFVMGLAVADTLMDFRSRWSNGSPPGSGGGTNHQDLDNE